MEMRWSLKELYTAFESAEYKRDLGKLDDLIVKTNKDAQHLNENKDNFTKEEVVKALEARLQTSLDISKLADTLYSFASLTNSTNVQDEDSIKYIQLLQSKFIEMTDANVKFNKWVCMIPNLDEIIDESDFLKEHRYYIHEIAKMKDYMLSDELELMYAKLQQTGSTAWVRLQSNVISTLMVDMEKDGKSVQEPLPVVRNMAYHKDAKVRKDAYEAELKAYKKVEDVVGASLNAIKGEVLTICDQRGYDSPLAMTLFNSRMEQSTLDAMLEAIRETLPEFRKYLKKKGELLGHKKGLPFYEMFAPMGQADMTYTYDEARDFIVENFGKFSSKLSDFAKNAFDKNWIDAEPRKGKRGGAFCSGIHAIGQSRILSNFTGSFSDVSTLAHELGHGYHGHVLSSQSALNSDYPMPLAETASIFCETIINNAVLENATPEQTFTLLEGRISDSTQTIVDIYSRFLFESALFEKRKERDLTVEELKETMLQAQKDAYGDGLDSEFLHPYMWACKPHYYYVTANFYNFPYAFGQLFALGLYAEYQKRGESFLEDYDKLLEATGKNDITDVVKLMGIDVNSVEFWKSSLNLIVDDINKFIEVCDA